VIVEDGDGQLRAGPHAVSITGRASVFEQPGWSAIVGPGARFELDGDLRATVVWRASARDTPTRVIDPAAIAEEVRGEGTTARRVRTYVAEGELIVGETLNPPGGWSSYPPHRHEHEELYLYRFDTDAGFGVHVSYDDTADAARVVRDGSIERITGGYHPVVAAPASAMYYLWALAGDHDTVDTEVDPHFLTPVSGTGESRAQGVASGGTDDRN
jgi:5-deoxy-glucuronate isomerase